MDNWRPHAHWQWWLTAQLRERGEQVLYPQLPRPYAPTLSDWLQVLHGELAQLGDGERVVVAHSAGAAFWLLAAPDLVDSERVERVLLVAPPSPAVMIGPYSALLPLGIEWEAVARASRQLPIIVSSDADPYFPEGLHRYPSIYSGPLGLEHHVLAGAGHLSVDDGYGPWSAMLEWCLQGRTNWAYRDAAAAPREPPAG